MKKRCRKCFEEFGKMDGPFDWCTPGVAWHRRHHEPRNLIELIAYLTAKIQAYRLAKLVREAERESEKDDD